MALADQAGLEYVDLAEAEPVRRSPRCCRRISRPGTRPSPSASSQTTCCSSRSPTLATWARRTTCASPSATTSASPSPSRPTSSGRSRSSTGRRSRSTDSGAEIEELFDAVAQREDIAEATDDTPAVKLVHATLAQAIEDGASDIHFEPQEEDMIVRARIDGVTRPIATIPKHDAARRDQPPEDHGRPRHRRAPRAPGRPRLDQLRRQPARPAHRDHADHARRAGRAPDHAPRGQQASTWASSA